MIQVTREQHTCPTEIQERLTRAGGTNQFGEPNFRCVWSGSRLGWIGGMWIEEGTEKFELRKVPKYLPPWDRWLIECYRPPEFYGSKWFWDFQTRVRNGFQTLPSLGPYPSRGDYELCEVLDMVCSQCLATYRAGSHNAVRDCIHRDFLPLSWRVVNMLSGMVRASREVKAQDEREAIARQIKREQDMEEAAVTEIMESAQSYQIPKSRQDYLDRFVVPTLEKKLARDLKKMNSLAPTIRARMQSGKAMALPN